VKLKSCCVAGGDVYAGRVAVLLARGYGWAAREAVCAARAVGCAITVDWLSV
jgi:hypothetical protein